MDKLIDHLADGGHNAQVGKTCGASMIFEPIEQDRTARAVERQIETMILEGVLRSGEKLPGERELAREMDVSRPIVREAVGHLEAKGLLVTRHGGGTFVADVIGTVFAAPVVRMFGRNAKARADFLEYRREIEGMTAALGARRATQGDLAVLDRTVDAMRAAHRARDAEREATADVEFHSAVGECAHNVVLMHTLRACYRLLADDVFLNRALVYGAPGMRERLLEQHEAIHAAIVARDEEGARLAARRHIDFVESATREMERSSDRADIARRRLEQRSGGERAARKRV